MEPDRQGVAGNRAASRNWKGAATELRLFTLLVILLLYLPTSVIQALDIYVNGESSRSYTECNLSTGTPYSYPGRDSVIPVEGYPLLELAPLMGHVWRVNIHYGDDDIAVVSGSDADCFHSWSLVRGVNCWDLRTESAIYENLVSLDIKGEELEAGELTVWLGWEGTEHLKGIIQRFANAHSLEIDIQNVPSILSKVTSVARGRGRIPDVFMVQSDYLPELIGARLIQRLDDIDNGGLLEKGKAAFSRDGNLWAHPLYFDTQLVFYNPRLVPTPPKNWNLDDFEHILVNLAENGVSPITWNAYSAYWLISFQIGFGKENLVERDGSLVIDDQATKDALSYILKLQDQGLLDIRERDGMMSRFITGNVGMILSGSYSIPSFREIGIPFATAPYPYNDTVGKHISPLLDFKGMAVSRRTYYPILARRLIEYLTDIGVQHRITTELSKLPVSRLALDMQRINKGEVGNQVESLLASYEIGTVIPPNDVYPIYKNTMWKMLSFAFSGQLGVEELLRQGQVIINEKQQRRISP